MFKKWIVGMLIVLPATMLIISAFLGFLYLCALYGPLIFVGTIVLIAFLGLSYHACINIGTMILERK